MSCARALRPSLGQESTILLHVGYHQLEGALPSAGRFSTAAAGGPLRARAREAGGPETPAGGDEEDARGARGGGGSSVRGGRSSAKEGALSHPAKGVNQRAARRQQAAEAGGPLGMCARTVTVTNGFTIPQAHAHATPYRAARVYPAFFLPPRSLVLRVSVDPLAML